MQVRNSHGASVDPSRQGRLTSVGRKRAKDLQECVLNKIVDVRVRPDHPEQYRVNAPPLTLKKFTEGGALARNASRCEVEIVRCSNDLELAGSRLSRHGTP